MSDTDIDTTTDLEGDTKSGDTDPALPTVIQAISRVMADLPGIGKSEKAPEKAGGYNYRGIEAITRELQPVLARHGVVIHPVVDLLTVTDQVPGMSTGWREHMILVDWYVYGPAGDRLDPCPRTYGIGRDNSDKGIPKGMTQAWKYLLVELFAIGDAKDDGDGMAASPDSHPAEDIPDAVAYITEDQYREVLTATKALTEPQRVALAAEWMAEDPMSGEPIFPVVDGKPKLNHLTRALLPAAHAMIRRYATWTADGADTPGDTPAGPSAATQAPTAGDQPSSDDTEPEAGPVDAVCDGCGESYHPDDGTEDPDTTEVLCVTCADSRGLLDQPAPPEDGPDTTSAATIAEWVGTLDPTAVRTWLEAAGLPHDGAVAKLRRQLISHLAVEAGHPDPTA